MNRPSIRVLVVGGGGHEHALCWHIRRDRPEAALYVAPGDGGDGGDGSDGGSDGGSARVLLQG